MASEDGSAASVVEQPTLQPELEAHLRSHCRVGDHWLFVHCGEWVHHPCGWEGPALAVFQTWKDGEQPDYVVWEIDQDWLPTGNVYQSGSGEQQIRVEAHTAHPKALERLMVIHASAVMPEGKLMGCLLQQALSRLPASWMLQHIAANPGLEVWYRARVEV